MLLVSFLFPFLNRIRFQCWILGLNCTGALGIPPARGAAPSSRIPPWERKVLPREKALGFAGSVIFIQMRGFPLRAAVRGSISYSASSVPLKQRGIVLCRGLKHLRRNSTEPSCGGFGEHCTEMECLDVEDVSFWSKAFSFRGYGGEKFTGVSESVCLGEGNNKSDFNLDIGNSMSTTVPRLCWLWRVTFHIYPQLGLV